MFILIIFSVFREIDRVLLVEKVAEFNKEKGKE